VRADSIRPRGRLTLAAALLILAGALNLVAGIEALHGGRANFAGPRVYDNLRVWGIVFLAWGAAQVLAGLAAFTRQPFGLSLGICLALGGAVVWLFFLLATPFEAFAGVALNVFVAWALLDEARREGHIPG
jgi:hypothetical protein